LWDAAKAVLRRCSMPLDTHVKRFKICNFSHHPQKLGEKEEIKPKGNRRKEIR
jgi:hypothetical protein